MFNFKKNIYAIFCASVLLMTGCSHNKYAYDKDSLSSNKAVIITRASMDSLENFIFNNKVKATKNWRTGWANTNQKSAFITGLDASLENDLLKKSFTYMNGGSGNYDVLTIEPGEYSMVKTSCKIGYGRLSNHIIEPGHITFKVMPGDVIYIGDIKGDDTEGLLDIRIIDNFAEAKNHIAMQHPELSSKLKSNLAKKDLNNTYRIIGYS